MHLTACMYVNVLHAMFASLPNFGAETNLKFSFVHALHCIFIHDPDNTKYGQKFCQESLFLLPLFYPSLLISTQK